MTPDKETYEGQTLLSITEIIKPPTLDGKHRILFRHGEDYFLIILSPDEHAFLHQKLDSITSLFDTHLKRAEREEEAWQQMRDLSLDDEKGES